jgi:hypothetical protein
MLGGLKDFGWSNWPKNVSHSNIPNVGHWPIYL